MENITTSMVSVGKILCDNQRNLASLKCLMYLPCHVIEQKIFVSTIWGHVRSCFEQKCLSHKWHCHVKRFMSTFSVIDFRMCPFRSWYCCAHVSVWENMQKIVWVGGSFCLNGAGKLNHTKRQKRFFWKVHGEMEGCSVKEIQVSAIRLEMKHYSK